MSETRKIVATLVADVVGYKFHVSHSAYDRCREPPVVSGLRSRSAWPATASPSSSTMPATSAPPKRWWRGSRPQGAARSPRRLISPIPPPLPVCSTLRGQRSAASPGNTVALVDRACDRRALSWRFPVGPFLINV
jgi:hypothetical protein